MSTKAIILDVGHAVSSELNTKNVARISMAQIVKVCTVIVLMLINQTSYIRLVFVVSALDNSSTDNSPRKLV